MTRASVFLLIFISAANLFAGEITERSQGGPVRIGTPAIPRIVEIDSNRDGKIDRTEHYKGGKIDRIEGDMDYDGIVEETTYYEDGKPVKTEQDLNKDGRTDVWIYY